MNKKTIKNYVHVMKYMGSKRELLEEIDKTLSRVMKEGDTLLDLFAGTCGVGSYFRDKYSIYSNDVQTYSKCISKGLLEVSQFKLSSNDVWNLLEPNYLKNKVFLEGKLKKNLVVSDYFINLPKWTSKELKAYIDFQKIIPSPLSPKKAWISTKYKEHNTLNKNSFPFLQTTFLFSEMYFSLQQAIELDSLKYAIHMLDEEYSELKSALEVSLIHAYSYTSAGTGHFAQFRDLKTLSSVTDVFQYRKRSVPDYFMRKTDEILQSSAISPYGKKSESFMLDYVDLLTNKKVMKKVSVIYADPPYSFMHYSRFYHAVENLCRYDYPNVKFKGRYREDRHQSSFCVKSEVENAFDLLFSLASKSNKKPVLLSYSKNGIIKLSIICDIARRHNYNIKLREINHRHSTMGRLGDKDRAVFETLLLCT